MPLGKTEIVQEAHTGYKVKVYKSTVENDSVVKKNCYILIFINL
ncbi:G5 domain-containing protein [Clostridium botulinum]|nr:G5 domain-containing protein [Clostridium botulinum]MCS4524369.1 G5 domain-containing protein [Clostridium botulinum]MCS4526397.1 G5 domain-containing protein [Clostridium botulinum]